MDTGSSTIVVAGKETDFADLLGVNSSALSRALARMRKDGIIDYRRNVLTLTD